MFNHPSLFISFNVSSIIAQASSISYVRYQRLLYMIDSRTPHHQSSFMPSQIFSSSDSFLLSEEVVCVHLCLPPDTETPVTLIVTSFLFSISSFFHTFFIGFFFIIIFFFFMPFSFCHDP